MLCRKPDLVPVRANEVELRGSLACPRIAPRPSPPTQMRDELRGFCDKRFRCINDLERASDVKKEVERLAVSES